MERLKLYLGGSLFTEAERDMREKEFKELQEQVGEFVEIYSPMHNDEINDKSKEINSEDIFTQDTREVMQSDFFYCNMEEIEKDPGLAMEVGIATGCNIMLDMMKNVLEVVIKKHKSLEHNGFGVTLKDEIMATMLETIPAKEIFVNVTDIRLNHKNPLVGLKKDASVNQFCLGGLEVMDARFGQGSKETIGKLKQALTDFEEIYNSLVEENK